MQTKQRSDAINLFKKNILWDFGKQPDLIKKCRAIIIYKSKWLRTPKKIIIINEFNSVSSYHNFFQDKLQFKTIIKALR